MLNFCLKALPGRKRSKVPQPTQAAKAPVKPELIQSVLERRLRRTKRRLHEVQKLSASWTLVRKVSLEVNKLSTTYPELSEFSIFDPNMLLSLEQCISKESAASSLRRISTWKEKMSEDEQALIRWVKGADNTLTSASKDPEVPIHPQLKAEFFARHWEKIWSPDEAVPPEALLPFLDWIPTGGFPCPDISLTGGHPPQAKQKRPQAKQQGLTDGLPMPGACLPHGFFRCIGPAVELGSQDWYSTAAMGSSPLCSHSQRNRVSTNQCGSTSLANWH